MGSGGSQTQTLQTEASQALMPIVVPRLGDPVAVSADERDEHLLLLEVVREAVVVEWTVTLAASVQAGDHHLHGYPSMVGYLKDRLGMGGGRAHRYVRNARAAGEYAATMAAWKHGLVSGDEAELLFRAAERTPAEYRRAEAGLLELVGEGVDDTRRVLDYWRDDVDRPGVVLEVEEQLERRHCDVARKRNGMVTRESSPCPA